LSYEQLYGVIHDFTTKMGAWLGVCSGGTPKEQGETSQSPAEISRKRVRPTRKRGSTQITDVGTCVQRQRSAVSKKNDGMGTAVAEFAETTRPPEHAQWYIGDIFSRTHPPHTHTHTYTTRTTTDTNGAITDNDIARMNQAAGMRPGSLSFLHMPPSTAFGTVSHVMVARSGRVSLAKNGDESMAKHVSKGSLQEIARHHYPVPLPRKSYASPSEVPHHLLEIPPLSLHILQQWRLRKCEPDPGQHIGALLSTGNFTPRPCSVQSMR
jgi:hypothetical protein